VPGPRAIARRAWPAIPVLAIALLLGLRALLHTPPLDALAPVASEPADPPATRAYAGSIAIARGGPVIIGFLSPRDARMTIAGRELRGRGLVKERLIIPHGPAAIRVALPDGARLVWSPVGRRGDPEYIGASSLSPDPPDRATFDHPGTAPLDGLVALGSLLAIVAGFLWAARRRIAAVPREMWIAMGIVFAAGMLLRLWDLGGAGQMWDEDVNWAAGRNYVSNFVAFDFSPSAWTWNYEHPPVMKYLAGIGAQFADGFGPARAISAFVVALGCALLVPIGARLYNLGTGTIAAALATLLPPLVGHGKIVGHEAPTVLWWSLGVLLALGVHDDLPEDHRRAGRVLALRLAGVGAIVGIAIASRFVNGLLGPLCGAIIILRAPPRWRMSTFSLGAAIMPIVALLVLYLVWPRLWVHPIAALELSFKKLDTVHIAEPFLGTVTAHPGPLYFVVYLFATLPFGLIALFPAWLHRAFRDREHRRSMFIVLAWLVAPLLAALSPVRQDGVRYIMPVFPAIAMMAASAIDRLPRRNIIAGVFIAYLVLVDLRTHPYYIDYFGEHTGGAGSVAANKYFETAWWGEGLAPSLAYVNAHAEANAKVSRHCVEPGHLAWFREDLWTIPPNPASASWIVVYAPARNPCPIPPDAKRVFAVEHDGVILSAVYRR
jgi:hypothetical protein